MEFFRNFGASRSTPAPSDAGNSLSYRWFKPPVAGVTVTPDSALTYSAYFACIRLLAESCAGLSWRVFHREDGRRKIRENDPVDLLLYRKPNPETTAFRLKELAVSLAASRGNAYFEIVRGRNGVPRELWPISNDAVNTDRDQSDRLVYDVSGEVFDPSDILHIRNITSDGVNGLSIAELARESISYGLATEQFGASFFGNGAFPATVIVNQDAAELSKDGVRNLLRTFNKKNRGAVNGNRTEYLSKGYDIKVLGISQKDSQFLESRKFQVTEICRWFRVPPHKLADLEKATFSNIEHQSIEFVTDAVLPWANRLESEVNFALLGEDTRRYSKLNINALLRGDAAARAAFYKELFYLGVLSIDEIREFEDMDALASDGDLRLVQANMVPVEDARESHRNAAQSGGSEHAEAIVLDVCRRLARVEVKRAEALAKRGEDEFRDGATQFYSKHADNVRDALENPVRMYSHCIGTDPGSSEAVLSEFAGRVAMDSADEIQAARKSDTVDDLLRSWSDKKAERMARSLISKIKRG